MIGLRTFSKKLRQFRDDIRGLAAVEFALIAPVLIGMTFAVYELSDALTIYRRTSSVASTVGDLTAQATQITNSEMQDILNSSAAVIEPYDTSRLKLRVFSIVFDGSGNPSVDWAENLNWLNDPQSCLDNIPEAVKIPNQSVICSEAGYEYDSMVAYIVKGTKHYRERYYLLPRRSLSVQRVT